MRSLTVVTLAFGLLSALACSLGTKCGEGTTLVDGACVAVEETAPVDTDTDTDVPVDDTSSVELTLPTITSFTADVTQLTQRELVTFTVAITDPQGADDIALGVLLAPGGTEYGSFANAGGGNWTIAVTWADFQAMNSIDFDTEEQRYVVAHFLDRSANTVDAETTLRLHCNGQGACAGVCTDLLNDAENCGTCGNTCDQCSDGTCYGYECVTLAPDLTTCDEACASIGQTCGGDVCSGGTTSGYMIGDGTCDSFTVYRVVDDCSTTFLDGYQLYGKCCCAG
jgi:hypothetical protein